MRLIIIDGLDGVGKDTHAELIKERYEELGENVVIRSHPSNDNYFGRKAKKALLNGSKLGKAKAAIFYMLDVLRSVKKYYNRSDIDTLIMIRYLVGPAYLPEKLTKIGYRFFRGFVPTSEYMFFFYFEPKLVLDRYLKRDELEVFENLNSLVKVRKKALNLVKDWYIVDTSDSIESTYNFISKKLDLLDKNE